MRGKAIRLAVAMLLFALSSCALPLPQVDDVAFVDAALVRSSDIPRQDRNTVDRSRDGPFLRVTVTSAYDLQKLARDWNYTIRWAASPCSGGVFDSAKRMDGYSALYDSHGPVNMYDQNRQTSGSGPAIRYHLYLSVKAEANLDLPTDERQYAYDLAAHPQDLCVQVSGTQEVDGDGWGFAKFQSNAAVIAQTVIAKAFR